jgi:hypothetical protein
MKPILALIHRLQWGMIILLCGTLGLAPFAPPHVIEKLAMLIKGDLTKPLDWFDLILHGFPWILLAVKIIAHTVKKDVDG